MTWAFFLRWFYFFGMLYLIGIGAWVVITVTRMQQEQAIAMGVLRALVVRVGLRESDVDRKERTLPIRPSEGP